jgi:hypothetical protein
MLPGEVFIDQFNLSPPACAPNVATFTASISDPGIMPVNVALLISPASETSVIGIEMEKTDRGTYYGTLQLDEDAPAGEWYYSVIALDVSGVTYRSEQGAISVNACDVAGTEPLVNDQQPQLAPYLLIGLIAIVGFGLFALGAALIVVRNRR